MAVYLLSASEFKQRMNIHQNVDDKLIKPIIRDAQNIWLIEIIGTGLLNQLYDQVTNSTLTALNTTLLNTYITPALQYWTMSRLVKPLTYRFMNIGVQKKSSENTEPISDEYAQTIQDDYAMNAEWYGNRITKYLCENSNSFPLYLNPGTGSDVIRPKGLKYNTGLYTKGGKRRKYGIETFEEPYGN